MSCVTIKRNREWFEKSIPRLQKFWDKVEEYRNNEDLKIDFWDEWDGAAAHNHNAGSVLNFKLEDGVVAVEFGGIRDLNVTGNDEDNYIIGNDGNNKIYGKSGNWN